MKSNLHIRSLLIAILKAAIFIATVFYIYIKVWKSGEPVKFGVYLHSLHFKEAIVITVVFLLMFINWGIETLKWKTLIKSIEFISFKNAFKAIMSGVTISNWIPNRLGEFIGRIIFISPGKRSQAAFATFTGGFAQAFATILFGLTGLLWWLKLSSSYTVLILIPALTGLLLMILIYFNLPAFANYISGKNLFRKLKKHLKGVIAFQRNDLLKVLILALLRYLIYASQYYLLLIAFKTDIGFSSAIFGIPLIFVIQAFIPSVTLTEIGIRGAVILAVFASYSANQTGLLLAAWSIWIINIIIPSFIGAFYLLLHKKTKEVTE